MERGLAVNNLGYLLAAFLVIWTAVFAYIYVIARRQHILEREVRALQEAIERNPPKS